MHDKKIIIGVSAYAGSNIPSVLKLINHNLLFFKYKTVFHSLKRCPIECVTNKILQDRRKIIHIISDVSSVDQIKALITSFENDIFEPIGIQVPFEDCFKFRQQQGEIGKKIIAHEYRQQDLEDPYRLSIMACFEEIKLRSHHIYKCDEGCLCEVAGIIVDEINRW